MVIGNKIGKIRKERRTKPPKKPPKKPPQPIKKPQIPFGICGNIHAAACRQTRLGRIRLRYRCTQQISSTASSASQEKG